MQNEYRIIRSGKRSEYVETFLEEKPRIFRSVFGDIAWKILKEFEKPSCPVDLAKRLGFNEQIVYYHVNRFKQMGLLSFVRSERRQGTFARFYVLRKSAVSLVISSRWRPFEGKVLEIPDELKPFFAKGKAKLRIIVGSPDPHGPWKGKALDAPTAIDLAFFLGSFVSEKPNPVYRLDTETKESDLRENLILVGGPLVNMVTKRVNRSLPIRFNLSTMDIVSKISGNVYSEEENGLIYVGENPFDRAKRMIVFAGKRFAGTRASILAFIQSLESVLRGNRFDRKKIARVVRGYDMDGDGIIDKAEILE